MEKIKEEKNINVTDEAKAQPETVQEGVFSDEEMDNVAGGVATRTWMPGDKPYFHI